VSAADDFSWRPFLERWSAEWVVLNPASVDARGEWEAAFFGNWIPGARVYPSFQALMEAEYALFCDLRDRGSIR
jgi:hypothetical protein